MTEIEQLKAERDFLYEALEEIAFAGMDQPAALGLPEEEWFRRRGYDLIGMAAWSLSAYRKGDFLKKEDE